MSVFCLIWTRLLVHLNLSCVFTQHLERALGTLCLCWTPSACPPCSQHCSSSPLNFLSDCTVQYKESSISSQPSSVLLPGCPATCCFSNTLKFHYISSAAILFSSWHLELKLWAVGCISLFLYNNVSNFPLDLHLKLSGGVFFGLGFSGFFSLFLNLSDLLN